MGSLRSVTRTARLTTRVPLPDRAGRACASAGTGVSSPSHATQKVGRRVGAHRRPRPGRTPWSRGFTGIASFGTRSGRCAPAAPGHGQRLASRDHGRRPRRGPGGGRCRHGRHDVHRAGSGAKGRSERAPQGRPARWVVEVRPQAREVQADGHGDVLRGGHDGDAPAARHDRHHLRRRRLRGAGHQRLRPAQGSSRIVDLYKPDFFDICGCPSWSGTTKVTVYVY